MPELDAVDLDRLARLARAKSGGALRVFARPFNDGDPAVFGAFHALQRVGGEWWYVRGVLRRRDVGPPLLRRVVVEHLSDSSREVSSTVMRELNFGTIRGEALIALREHAGSKALLAESGLVTVKEAELARRAAIEAAKGKRGPHGAYPVERYRHVAVRYLAVQDQTRAVIKALCEEAPDEFGEPVEYDTMRDWIRKATKLGFLEPGTAGVPGRKPGRNLNLKEE